MSYSIEECIQEMVTETVDSSISDRISDEIYDKLKDIGENDYFVEAVTNEFARMIQSEEFQNDISVVVNKALEPFFKSFDEASKLVKESREQLIEQSQPKTRFGRWLVSIL